MAISRIIRQWRIPRFVVKLIAIYIVYRMKFAEYEITGSYRRGKKWCTDIDLLVSDTGIDLRSLDAKMRKIGWYLTPFRNHDAVVARQYMTKFMGKYLVLDIFLYNLENRGNLRLFSTGSKRHNDELRKKLNSMGYTWGRPAYFEHLVTGERVSFNDEAATWHFINTGSIQDPKNR